MILAGHPAHAGQAKLKAAVKGRVSRNHGCERPTEKIVI